jgi:hypothetical protein
MFADIRRHMAVPLAALAGALTLRYLAKDRRRY